ncbi:MFS transporter [Actinoplanes subtropicus]|uniref:MFS transporter n=1 Tax=Actinoplanes subtropicus TaxID=543632 RepID=UPI00068C5B9C|nr:MFS transporter [Actinoplanes subtropicus]
MRIFRNCAFALFVLIVGTNLPSPLYAVYAHSFGFSPVVLTLIFATYPAVLVPSLLLAGSAADAWGYRRVLLPGLATAVAGALVFAYAEGMGWLFLARALQGAAAGMSSGALTAALARTEPRGNGRRASMAASIATTAGGGFGPVLAGACAAWLPAPTRLCYLLSAGALIVAATGLLGLPASLGRTGRPWRVSLPRVPGAARVPFGLACATGCTGWAVTAVFLSMVPSYLRSLTGDRNLFLAGFAAGLVLLVAAAVQPLTTGIGARSQQRSGLLVLTAGAAVLLIAGPARSPALVIAAAVLVGVGQGLSFMGAVRAANLVAPAESRAAVVSTLYMASYVGVGVPAVGVGLLSTLTSTTTAVAVFAVVALLVALAVAAMHARSRSERWLDVAHEQPVG